MIPDVMGTNEIAALLGVSRQRVAVLAQRPDFPWGLELARGTIWDGPTMRAYAHDRTDPDRDGTDGIRHMRLLETYRRTGSINAASKAGRMTWETGRQRLEDYGVLTEDRATH